MKIKVVKNFVDKQSHKFINAGDEITVSDERGEELIVARYAVEIKGDQSWQKGKKE